MQGRRQGLLCGVRFRVGPEGFGEPRLTDLARTKRDQCLQSLEWLPLDLAFEGQRSPVHENSHVASQAKYLDRPGPSGERPPTDARRKSPLSDELVHEILLHSGKERELAQIAHRLVPPPGQAVVA